MITVSRRDSSCSSLKLTVLGKKDYKDLGKMLHGDEHFFEGVSTTSYNYSDSHAQTKRLGDSSFGDNTTTVSYRDVAINCVTVVELSLSVLELFGQFEIKR